MVNHEEEAVTLDFSPVERTELQPRPIFSPQKCPQCLAIHPGAQRETGTWESELSVPSPELEEQWIEIQLEIAPSWHLTAWPLQPLQLSFLPLLHQLFQ